MERRYEFDWLRLLVMLNVFLFHCALFFSKTSEWHAKNNELTDLIDIPVIGLSWMYMMPVFFFVSGLSTWYALKKRDNKSYITDRFKRLFIPLYTVGLFILLPPQYYFEIVTNEGFTGTFCQSLPLFFSHLGFALHKGPYVILTSLYGQLWFLLFLFSMSLLTLPLCRLLQKEKVIDSFTKRIIPDDKFYRVLIFLIPLLVFKICLVGFFQNEDSWADFFFHLVFFMIGFIIPSSEELASAIKKHLWLFLVMGILGFGGVGIFTGALLYGYPGHEAFHDPLYIPFQIIISVTQFGFVLFWVSLFMRIRFFNTGNKLLSYGNEAILPFYMLHQTSILIVGWFIKDWAMGIPLKFIILVLISFLGFWVPYIIIKRINVLRFLFGMRIKSSPIN